MGLRVIASLILIPLFVLSSYSQSEWYFYSGNRLVEDMREFDKAAVHDRGTDFDQASKFMGYVIGVSDAFTFGGLKLPNEVTAGQMCTIVSKYLKDHPEKWDKPAVVLIRDAIVEAFQLREK